MTITVEQLKEMVYEVNSYDGSLEEFDYQEMEHLNDLGLEPLELLSMAQFGNFNCHNDYFIFNGYGNLESISENYFHGELIDNSKEIVERYNELVEAGDIEPIE